MFFSANAQDNLIMFRGDNGKRGVKNITDAVIIQPMHDWISSFSERCAEVKSDRKTVLLMYQGK
jgi:hypothetical protein